ncbi:MAG: glutathione S-transferase [Robiginitomaculum sp.]|nr:glutathione S-transferase [Robiginitomaculum sp.]
MSGKLELADCVNKHCPNSGKPVSVDGLTVYKGKVVGFCNPNCRDTFENALRVFDDCLEK